MRLLAQNRKALAKGSPIQTLAGNLVHPLICYTRRQVPPYSDAVIGCAFLKPNPSKKRVPSSKRYPL